MHLYTICLCMIRAYNIQTYSIKAHLIGSKAQVYWSHKNNKSRHAVFKLVDYSAALLPVANRHKLLPYFSEQPQPICQRQVVRTELGFHQKFVISRPESTPRDQITTRKWALRVGVAITPTSKWRVVFVDRDQPYCPHCAQRDDPIV